MRVPDASRACFAHALEQTLCAYDVPTHTRTRCHALRPIHTQLRSRHPFVIAEGAAKSLRRTCRTSILLETKARAVHSISVPFCCTAVRNACDATLMWLQLDDDASDGHDWPGRSANRGHLRSCMCADTGKDGHVCWTWCTNRIEVGLLPLF